MSDSLFIHDKMQLLACVFSLMPAAAQRRVYAALGDTSLDKAVLVAVRAKKFPDWFVEDFTYDPLYGMSDDLRLAMQYMLRDGYATLETGVFSRYHFKATPGERERILANLRVPLADAEALAAMLAEHILAAKTT